MWTKYRPLIIGIAVLLVFLLIGYKSCRLYDQNSKLKGRIDVLTVELQKSEAETAKVKEAFDKTVAEKDLEIVKWQEVSKKNEAGMTAGDKKIRDLKEQLAKLDPAEKDVIILKQKELIETLENNLTLAYGDIVAKDQIIANLQYKFDACMVYTVQLEKEIKIAKELSESKDQLIAGLEGSLKTARFWGGTTKITTIAAGVALVAILVAK